MAPWGHSVSSFQVLPCSAPWGASARDYLQLLKDLCTDASPDFCFLLAITLAVYLTLVQRQTTANIKISKEIKLRIF